MAPARKVGGLHCQDSLDEAARTILSVRLDEVEDLRTLITGPADSQALHNLRIAAKRLRYSLEMFTVCFPETEAQSHADLVRDMQDILGRIHDLDVLQGLLLDRIALIDQESRERALEIATSPALEKRRQEELQDMVRGDEQGDGRLGLYTVIAAKAEERREQYARFESLWTEWEQYGLLRAIRTMISPVPVAVG